MAYKGQGPKKKSKLKSAISELKLKAKARKGAIAGRIATRKLKGKNYL